MRKSNIFFAIIFLIGAVIGSFLIYIYGKQQKISIYDPDSYGPFGLKALHLLLEKHQYQLNKKTDFYDAGKHDIILGLTSDYTALPEKKQILKWIKSGGILIEFAQAKPQFVRKKCNYIPDLNKKIAHSKQPGFDFLAYHIKSSRLYGISEPQNGFYSIDNQYFIFIQGYGKGKILTWSDPDGLVNQSLVKSPDNAVILLMLLKRLKPTGTVKLIDWRYPAIPTDGLHIQDVFNRYAVASLLLLSGIFIIIWKLSSRFGRPYPLTLSKGRSYDEFVSSLAGLFQHAESNGIVLDNLRQDLQRVIIQITGLSPQATVPEQISRLEEITGKNYQNLLRLFNSIQNKSATSNVSKQTFFTTAVKLDTYRKELLEWKKSTYSSIK